MPKFSNISVNTSPALSDTAIGVGTPATTPADQQTAWSDIFKMLANGSGNSLGSQVQTYTPSVSGVSNITTGTPVGYYINLGGIRLCWGTIGYSYNGSNSSGHAALSLPSSFFTTVQAYLPAIQAEGNYAFQVASGDSIQGGPPPTTFDFYVSNGGSSGSGVVSWFIIGT